MINKKYDVLISFGFGPKWSSWIRGSLSSGKASILVNGSPTTEFHLYRGLKQGDPLAPFLFLLIMESLHLSFSRAVEAGIFKGYMIDPSTTLSHLFYADEPKSHLLGVGIPDNCVSEAAKSIGCLIMKAPFKYLGILVGDNMSSKKAWDETINKMKKRLSRWKLNTLSVGGRLTLLKSVLGSTPIYNMSIFKVPKSVLNYMESLRRNFFNGFQEGDRKIAWVKWSKVLASKKFGGLGVSSFFALNRALLFKWVWRYLSHDNSLWSRIISALHGLNGHVLSAAFNSTWSSIITEVNSLKVKGVDLISHCKIRVGKGTGTSFWKDLWIGDNLLKLSFPRLFALEENKDISVADKMNTSISSSFRRHVRGGVESQQLDQLSLLLDTVILSNMDDRWFWDLNGDGVFQVKDVRSMLDEAFLPKMEVPTRWIKSIPIKVNVFAWKLYLDRLPTRSNLSRRNVSLPSLACPLCDHVLEDSSHLFFGCSVAKDIQKLICRWWNLDVHPYESYEDWLSWFKSIRLGSKTKEVLEGVFYVSWWSLWNFRNQFLFASPIPRKDAIFDNIVLRSFYWCVARCNRTLNWDDQMGWDLNGEVFIESICSIMLDEAFLPKMGCSTRWNVSLPSLACPLCDHVLEDSSHLFFGCSVAKDIQKLICRWWNLDVHPYESYEDWLSWFKSIRLGLDEMINKMKKRLSRWKLNTLSVGGRLTLLKSVLGSTPIYNMSIFKVPKSVLNYMESLRRNFFNGFQEGDRKIAWVKWSKVLASKKFGGFTWLDMGHVLSAAFNSTWSSIITEVNSLKVKGVDLISHCKIRVGKGTGTSFWKDLWIGDNLLKLSFPRLFALEENKDISVG
ncbi:RNA-directed DNA polymerase, eukaryota [Tanacetum coccineum]